MVLKIPEGRLTQPTTREPPIGNFAMTLKIHVLLAVIVWAGLVPDALAEEKAGPKESPTQELEAKAAKGDPESQFRLGVHHQIGLTGEADLAQAIRWFRKAAEQGYLSAQKRLGNLCLFSEGVPKDETEGLKWYRKAAEQGDAESIFYVGACYNEGLAVPKDQTEAAKWWRKGADKGDDGCQVNLGVAYMNGWGVQEDEIEAVHWFR